MSAIWPLSRAKRTSASHSMALKKTSRRSQTSARRHQTQHTGRLGFCQGQIPRAHCAAPRSISCTSPSACSGAAVAETDPLSHSRGGKGRSAFCYSTRPLAVNEVPPHLDRTTPLAAGQPDRSGGLPYGLNICLFFVCPPPHFGSQHTGTPQPSRAAGPPASD